MRTASLFPVVYALALITLLLACAGMDEAIERPPGPTPEQVTEEPTEGPTLEQPTKETEGQAPSEQATGAATRQTVFPTSPSRATARPPLAQTSTQTDRDALVAFYKGTDGSNWDENDNWLSFEPIGKWYGVTTDSNGRVTELSLYSNRGRGRLPLELGNLSKLVRLNLTSSNLSGEIPPELGNLSNLN